jgi:hypothetical protein
MVLTREELYQRVWPQPMSKLAKVYGISEVGLAKICKRLNVPLPPQGYWARKKRHQPPPLPATNGHTCHELQVQKKPRPVQVPGFIDPRSEKICAIGRREQEQTVGNCQLCSWKILL